MKHIDRTYLIPYVQKILSLTVTEDYARILASSDKFIDDVIDDIETSSGWKESGYYTDSDVRHAIGRVITLAVTGESV